MDIVETILGLIEIIVCVIMVCLLIWAHASTKGLKWIFIDIAGLVLFCLLSLKLDEFIEWAVEYHMGLTVGFLILLGIFIFVMVIYEQVKEFRENKNDKYWIKAKKKELISELKKLFIILVISFTIMGCIAYSVFSSY